MSWLGSWTGSKENDDDQYRTENGVHEQESENSHDQESEIEMKNDENDISSKSPLGQPASPHTKNPSWTTNNHLSFSSGRFIRPMRRTCNTWIIQNM